MRYNPRFRFAVPGIIALLILVGVKDLLPEWLRIYAMISVAGTLAMALLTGQLARLNSPRDRVLPDSPERQRDYGFSSVILAFVGVLLVVTLTATVWLFIDQERTRHSLFGTLLIAGFIASPFELGALLVGFRTRQTKWGRTGLTTALVVTALLLLAWTVQILSIILPR